MDTVFLFRENVVRQGEVAWTLSFLDQVVKKARKGRTFVGKIVNVPWSLDPSICYGDFMFAQGERGQRGADGLNGIQGPPGEQGPRVGTIL